MSSNCARQIPRDNFRSLCAEIHQKLNSTKSLSQESFSGLERLFDSESIVTQAMNDLEIHELHLRTRITQEFFAWGPLTPLLDDLEITEILICSHDSIWFEKEGKLSQHPDFFSSPLTYRNCLQRLNREAKLQTSMSQPIANGRWRDFRVNIADEAITQNEAQLSLRRHPKVAWNLEKLLEQDWCTEEESLMLQSLIDEKANFLIIGGTGSGKTSLLNACLQELPSNERLVVIEDCDEISLPSTSCSKLLTRQDPTKQLPDIDQSDLLKQALRMRPDRIVVGEIRGAEAKDLLMALSTGHGGSLGTLHASSPKQALIRLEMLIQLGAPQWQIGAVRNLIHMGLNYILVAQRKDSGQRCFGGLYRIACLEQTGFVVEKLTPQNYSSKSQLVSNWLSKG